MPFCLTQLVLVVFTIFFGASQQVGPQNLFGRQSTTEENNKNEINKHSPFILHDNNKSEQQKPNNNSNKIDTVISNNNNSIKNATNSYHEAIKEIEDTFIEPSSNVTDSGALNRAILVVVALSFLFILYLGVKTWRKQKVPSDKSKIIVKKYGVRTRRNDLEMEPLDLSENDDEDETVFDLTSNGNHRI